ncbi:hypothetical protein [Cryptosporangium phraense]|uniref:DUF2637 domain-containing protein n=1 Tax=Cryptosporangium phraense TaxID=2593070 RepID=A0A545ASM1_9ACTN|nr:hypothetical protein [Cryptosporangium phraense]TQS44336.1 hypothetical protein FL583_15500 [Cryptosporangium phraense]
MTVTTPINVKSVERAGRAVNGALWVVFALVAYFSAGNVFELARNHDTPWYVAWVLAPIVDVALFAAFNGDAFLARIGVHLGFGWPTILRIFTGGATWLLNTWQSLGVAGPADPTGIVLHSIPPIVLVFLAESAPVYRAAFSRALSMALDKEAESRAGIEAEKQAIADHYEARIADIELRHRADIERLEVALERARLRAAKPSGRRTDQTTRPGDQNRDQADLVGGDQKTDQVPVGGGDQKTDQTLARSDDEVASALWTAWQAEVIRTGKGLSRYRVETDGKCAKRQALRVIALLEAQMPSNATDAPNDRTSEEVR